MPYYSIHHKIEISLMISSLLKLEQKRSSFDYIMGYGQAMNIVMMSPHGLYNKLILTQNANHFDN